MYLRTNSLSNFTVQLLNSANIEDKVMRTVGKASTIILSLGLIGYGGCSVFTAKEDVAVYEAPLAKYNFSYNVVMDHRPAADQMVFDDGKKTYFKIPQGDYIKKAYKVTDSGYELVNAEQGASYWSANEVGAKWILFTAGGHNIVSQQVERPAVSTIAAQPKAKEATNNLSKATVQQRIKQLESKLSGLVNILDKFSSQSPKAKQLLATINEAEQSKQEAVKSEVAVSNQPAKKESEKDDSVVYIKPQVKMVKVEDSSTGKENVMIKRDGYYSKPLTPNEKKDLAEKSKAMKAKEEGSDVVAQEEAATKSTAEKFENISENKAIQQEQKQASIQKESAKKIEEETVVAKSQPKVTPLQSVESTPKTKALNKREVTYVFKNEESVTEVPFAHGYRVLGPKARTKVNNLTQAASSAEQYKLTGLATQDGTHERNEWLAAERAFAVKAALINAGIAPEKIVLIPRDDSEYGLAVKVSVSYKSEAVAQN